MNIYKFVSFFVLFVILVIIFLLGRGDFFSFKENVQKSDLYSLNYIFNLNELSSYKFNFNQTSTILLEDNIPFIQEFSLDAFLHVKVIEKDVDNDEIYTLMQFSEMKLKSNQKGFGIVSKSLQNLYGQLFIVKFNKYGTIIDISFNGLKENYTSLKYAISLLQFTNKKYKYYEVSEFDTNGKYKTAYTKNKDVLEKKIDSYYDDFNKQNFQILDNLGKAKVDKNGTWLKSMNSKISLKSKTDQFKNKNIIKLKKIYTNINKNLEIYSANESVDFYMKKFRITSKNDEDIWKKIYTEREKKIIKESKINFAQVVQILKNNPKDAKSFLLLKKYLKANPQDISIMLKEFNNFEDFIQKHIISTLELLGNKEAQKALIKIAKDSEFDEDDNIRAIVSIGSVKTPISESVDALEEVIDENIDINEDKTNTSILALGTLGNKMNEKKDHIIEKIKQMYQSANTYERKRALLYSFENAGAEDFVKELENELNSKSKINRQIAKEILSKIKQ